MGRVGHRVGLNSTLHTGCPYSSFPKIPGVNRIRAFQHLGRCYRQATSALICNGVQPQPPDSMPPWSDNPFALLTLIAAPAILTNSSSVMTMGTSNRFARSVDRVRALAALVDNKRASPDDDLQLYVRQLRKAERRAQLIVRALTSFYLAVGSFAASALVSLIGAVFFVAHLDILRTVCMFIGLTTGLLGVGGLVSGALLLVIESRLTLRMLMEESEHRARRGIAAAGQTLV